MCKRSKKVIATALACVMASSMLSVTVSADKWYGNAETGYKYQYDDGTYADSGWLTVGTRKYYITSAGIRKTGWLETKSGNKYYFMTKKTETKNVGEMVKGWLTINDSKYYFADNGVMVTGQLCIGNKVYEFNADGVLIKTGVLTYHKKIVTETTTTLTVTDERTGEVTSTSKMDTTTTYEES